MRRERREATPERRENEAQGAERCVASVASSSQEGKGRDLRVETSAHPTGRQTDRSELELKPHSVEGEAAARRTRVGRSVSALEWSSEGIW